MSISYFHRGTEGIFEETVGGDGQRKSVDNPRKKSFKIKENGVHEFILKGNRVKSIF